MEPLPGHFDFREKSVPLEAMRWLDRVAAGVENATILATAGAAGRDGLQALALPGPISFWARLTALTSVSQAKYTFTELFGEGPPASNWGLAANGMTGSCYEVSTNASVPADPTTGAIVRVWLGCNEDWNFSYQATAAGGPTDSYTVNLITNAIITIQGDTSNVYVFGVPLKLDDWLFLGVDSYTGVGGSTIDDWAPSSRRPVWRLLSTGSGDVTLTGIVPATPASGAAYNGQVLFLLNCSGLDWIFKSLDPGSTSGNQIKTPDNYDLHLRPGSGIGLIYDPISELWRTFTMEAGGYTGTQDVVVDASPETIVTNNYYNGRLQPPTGGPGGGSLVGTGVPVSATEAPPITGTPFTGTVATFTDPSGPGVPGDYGAVIDWGDLTLTTTGTITGPVGVTFTVTGSHIYTEEGAYTVTVTLSKIGEADTVVTAPATVADPSVIAAGDNINVGAGLPFFNLSTAHFNDPGGPESLSDYSALIDWGDGNPPQTGTISGPDPGGQFIVTGSWVYSTPGGYTITTTISHDVASDVVVTSSATVF